MIKNITRWIVCILALCILLAVPATAGAASRFPDSLYLTQASSGTCTLCSSTMMIRARMYLSNNNNWSKVTEKSVRSYAWVSGSGIGWKWTYKTSGCSISVTRKGTSGISVSQLKSILDAHPEGIVLYVASVPHAVFLMDYEGDTFYCADTSSYYSGKRIPLADSWTGRKVGNQAAILKKVSAYWYVSSYSIPECTGETETNICNCTDEFAGEYICTAENELGIRTSHDSTANVIGSIPAGATVNVTKIGETWAHVEYNSIVGYVYKEYLKSPFAEEEEEEEVEEPSRPTGDLNGDYKLTNTDMVVLSRYLVDVYEADSERYISSQAYGDMNTDGKVSNLDLLILSRTLVDAYN